VAANSFKTVLLPLRTMGWVVLAKQLRQLAGVAFITIDPVSAEQATKVPSILVTLPGMVLACVKAKQYANAYSKLVTLSGNSGVLLSWWH
jgi:hypothetical protein